MTDQPGPRTGGMDDWIQLASGIAFELRSSLMAVHGYTELALEELGPAHPVAKHLVELKKAADRASHTVDSLGKYARAEIEKRRAAQS